MMVRIYERQIAPTSFTHAFYAISSYSQLELAKEFDAVSYTHLDVYKRQAEGLLYFAMACGISYMLSG